MGSEHYSAVGRALSVGETSSRDRRLAFGGTPPLLELDASTMTFQERIVRDPAISGGQPVIKGTRVLVRVLLGYLAHGEPTATILKEFPSISEEDLRAVIAFAAASAAEDLPAPSPVPPDAKVA
jgi:uncharacterized protein (DUF433 family)